MSPDRHYLDLANADGSLRIEIAPKAFHVTLEAQPTAEHSGEDPTR